MTAFLLGWVRGIFKTISLASLGVVAGALALNLVPLSGTSSVATRGVGGGDVQSAAVRDDRLPFNIRVTGNV